MTPGLKSRPLFFSPRRKAALPPKPSWFRRWLGILGRALRKTCTAVGALVIFSVFASLMLLSGIADRLAQPLPKSMILHMTLEGEVVDSEDADGFGGEFSGGGVTLREIVDSLDRAATDPRVKGLVLSLHAGFFDVTHLQELRDALLRFRKSGKKADVYAVSYGETGSGLGGYFLASACDRIWMQPAGFVSLTGIHLELPFVRGFLDKVGVTPQIIQRREYKTAMETFTHAKMSEPNREMLEALVADLDSQLEDGIAQGRKMSRAQVRALIDQGLFSGEAALKAGLIDRLDYGDVLVDDLRTTLGGDVESLPLIDLQSYHAEHALMPPQEEQKPARRAQVAVAYVTGLIATGVPQHQEVVDTLFDMADDPEIAVVVVRVDSPGGSPAASETLRRALMRVREKGKTVIVSMGAEAASGGYWIALGANRIVAQPGTLTGSIGVVGGKYDLSGLWGKLGVEWDSVQRGQNAGVWSFNAPFSESERKQVEAMLDDTYAQFTQRVAESRKLTPQQVEAIARGRVWTGRQAKERGLVDDLGGLDVALEIAAKTAGVAGRQDLDLVLIPHPKTPIEKVMEFLDDPTGMGVVSRLRGAMRSATAEWSLSRSGGARVVSPVAASDLQ